MDTLRAFDWASRIPVPRFIGSHDTNRMLDDTLAFWPGVFNPLIFCIGIVLLFSKERGRRRNRLDWTRRWGVLCSYVTLLLSAAPVLYVSALVAVGISALFITLPPSHQPAIADWLLRVSYTYLRYGPQPKDVTVVVLVAFSSITVVLACARLFDALRITGPKALAATLLVPLALFALVNLFQAGRYWLAVSTVTSTELFHYGVYFRPEFVLTRLADGSAHLSTMPVPVLVGVLVEIAKWCIVLTIAVWLSTAQVAAWRSGRTAEHRPT
jgi:hypothetical protein